MLKTTMKIFNDLKLPRDIETHSLRVCEFCEIIGNEVQRHDRSISIDIEAMKEAALLHDVGKIKIPSRILHKPGAFTKEEKHAMDQHAKFSGHFAYEFKLDPKIIKIILHHHERCDGSGYPFGTKVTDIETKILMIADVFDALISDRPYREGFSIKKALMEIGKEKDKYDPFVLECFLNLDFANMSYLEIA